MMRKRENPHHSIWAKFLVWRCATYKPYSCSHAAGEQRFACHLQTLQLFPRSRKTDDFLATYNPTVSQLFPRSSVQSKPSAFANPVQFSSVVNLETQASFFSCYRVAEKQRFCSPLTNPTVSQWFPRSSVLSKPCAFANPVQFSSIVTSETGVSCYLQTLQLFPRSTKTAMFLLPTKLTVVPTQQKLYDRRYVTQMM